VARQSYALRGCSRALLAGSKPALASCWQVAAGGDRWLLMAVRGHLGDTAGAHPQCVGPGADFRVTARTVQGMARVRSGQAAAWPLASDRSGRRGSGVKRDFACTFTRRFSPVLVARRSQSRLMLEGRARTLSGPSPDLSPARTLASSGRLPTALFPASTISLGIGPIMPGRAAYQPAPQTCSSRD